MEEDDNEEISIMRAELRENFLKKLAYLQGKTCNLNMYENTKVQGVFKGADVELQELLISELATPTCVVPYTIIRASDTIAVEFNGPADSL